MSAIESLRQRFLTAPIFKWAQGMLPAMSATESEAIEAGDTWWDAALFSGNPNWQDLLSTKPATLSEEERAFLAGPVEELCRMVDDWRVRFVDFDLSPQVWAFL
jgi:acyl-CoA dehydrogenase